MYRGGQKNWTLLIFIIFKRFYFWILILHTYKELRCRMFLIYSVRTDCLCFVGFHGNHSWCGFSHMFIYIHMVWIEWINMINFSPICFHFISFLWCLIMKKGCLATIKIMIMSHICKEIWQINWLVLDLLSRSSYIQYGY